MMTRDEGDYWFAPKRYGYGVGLPLTWQAWQLSAVYVATVIAAGLFLIERTIFGFVAVVTLATIAFLIVCAGKTRGGWRWRWGGKD